MSLPHICLIYTGGTIGMVREGGVLRPPADPSAFLEIAPELSQVADITFVPLMNKDSANISPQDWTTIAEAIHERMGTGFDGFVVAHGTDTMQFTASAVAFAFGPELSVPIVFTGSQSEASNLHGDARMNLVRAALVASGSIAEVVIVFGDYVFRAVRSQKRDRRRFAAFESPAYAPLAEIADEIIVHPDARVRRPGAPVPELRADFSADVVQVTLIPGLHADSVLPLLTVDSTRGVILQSYGAGNVPDAGRYSLVPFIEAAVATDVPVILTSQFPANSTLHSPYATGVHARRAGAIATGNMTNSAACVKFRWILAELAREAEDGAMTASDKLEQVRARMTSPYVGELDVEPSS
ncbi:MAG TPA: asparaginase [Solirubrobacteraceae bacterium]|jgi:L-asparaginase|nr:asparaginase [Solirubrobacteraceae bacterium]